MARKKDLSGIEVRHRQQCRTRHPQEHRFCACRPTFRPSVTDPGPASSSAPSDMPPAGFGVPYRAEKPGTETTRPHGFFPG